MELDKSLYAKVIGLTGSSGSGKTSVLKILEQLGQSVLSADELAKEILQPSTEAYKLVLKEFGEDILEAAVVNHPDQRTSKSSEKISSKINRQKLGQIVFANPDKRAILESIVHPAIREAAALRIARHFNDCGCSHLFYDIPLLFEKNLDILGFKKIILVSAPEHVLVERIMNRDSLSRVDAENRLSAQLEDHEKRKRSDYIIDNTGSLDDLKTKVEKLLHIL